MLLSEILEINYNNRNKDKTEKTQISEVYGIIYRIYCIPEKKSYVGQTFSHGIALQYLQRHGIIKRCKIHYRVKDYDNHKNRPLYKALNKYSSDQFEVFEERKVFGTELATLNQIEGEYIEKFNCLHPNGYNMEEIGKKYSQILQMLSEYHHFQIQSHDYNDKTRKTRCKDVCFGKRFGLERARFSKEFIRETLKTIDIESIRLVDSNGYRLIVKETGKIDNIRIYFSGTKRECVKFANSISPNVIETESFQGMDCYPHQIKLDTIVSLAESCTKIRGKKYKNKANGAQTYLIVFYGKKDGKTQPLLRISFGGKNMKIEKSSQEAMEFLGKFIKQTSLHYDLQVEI